MNNLADRWSAHPCTYCGGFHQGTCPRVASIEYHPDGTVKRVTFHSEQPLKRVGQEKPARGEQVEAH